MNQRRRPVGIFAREPVPGQTKTRLARDIGAEAAATLARAFVEDLLEALGDAFDVTIFCAEAAPGPILAELAGAGRATLAAQVEGDLGERMAAALAQLGPRGALVGSDAPTLRPSELDALFSVLDASAGPAIALCPAADGGFVAIASNTPAALAPVFSDAVRWSSKSALGDLGRAARRAGIEVALAPPWWDVDSGADLGALAAQLCLVPHRARRTASILADPRSTWLRGF